MGALGKGNGACRPRGTGARGGGRGHEDAGGRALRLEATLCARAVHVREAVVWLGLGVGLGLGLGLGLG